MPSTDDSAVSPLMAVIRAAEKEADRTWDGDNEHDTAVMFDYVSEWVRPLVEAARAVVNEWDVRGDGGCTKTLQDQLREALG